MFQKWDFIKDGVSIELQIKFFKFEGKKKVKNPLTIS